MSTDHFHPGEYIAEELEARGWTRRMFATASGLELRIIDELIAKERPVTRVIAACLETAFGVSAETWRNLQAMYDSEAARKDGEL